MLASRVRVARCFHLKFIIFNAKSIIFNAKSTISILKNRIPSDPGNSHPWQSCAAPVAPFLKRPSISQRKSGTKSKRNGRKSTKKLTENCQKNNNSPDVSVETLRRLGFGLPVVGDSSDSSSAFACHTDRSSAERLVGWNYWGRRRLLLSDLPPDNQSRVDVFGHSAHMHHNDQLAGNVARRQYQHVRYGLPRTSSGRQRSSRPPECARFHRKMSKL